MRHAAAPAARVSSIQGEGTARVVAPAKLHLEALLTAIEVRIKVMSLLTPMTDAETRTP